MSARVVVVYHSRGGRTRALADEVVRGARQVDGVGAGAIDVERGVSHEELAAADAIVFGSPTYMGSASAPFKAFMDATAPVWALQGWRDKLAAGFTHSAAPSGDKLGTLTQLAVFAAQHGMVWVGLGLPPSYAAAASGPSAEDTNRLGSHLGAMAQSPPGGAGPSEGDRQTCAHLGRRVAELAVRWKRGRASASASMPAPAVARHPAASTWRFPPADRAGLSGVRRTNLRELAARPGRFEHHLVVVARGGGAQLEIATASEPLSFAHVNVSDEYAVALPTGDDAIDRFPLRTFLTDPVTLEDVARYNHRVGDLVLHPFGLMHWPGRLRPPFEPFAFPAGMRRCGVTLVFCASAHAPPRDRPLVVTPGREGDAKSYAAAPPPLGLWPLGLWELGRADAGIVARVADASLELLVRPQSIGARHGAYVVVLEADAAGAHHGGDLLYLEPGAPLAAAGIARALVFRAESRDVEPPPSSWDAVPAAPMPVFDEARRAPLPAAYAGVELASLDAMRVTVRVAAGSATVPRHWLARMLYRIALHCPALGYVETYGGFFYDDRASADGIVRFGVHEAGGSHEARIAPADVPAFIEGAYRAVAPDGYMEL
jgi:multimeric flavodoxin WrbA